MSVLLHDLRYAIRTLRRNPGYTSAALLTLVIGIGSTVAVFSVVRGVLLAPLPYPEPDRLVYALEESGNGGLMGSAWRNFLDWRDRQRTFEAMAAYSRNNPTAILGLGRPVRVGVSSVSTDFFATLRVSPVRGRVMLPEEHELGGPPAVVVSDGFWRTYLGSDPDFAATEIDVGGSLARVVGVMPPGFSFPDGADIWIPAEITPQSESRSAHNFRVVGRLAAGMTVDRAESDLAGITAAFLRDDPGVADETWFADFYPRGARAQPLRSALVGDTRRPLLILLGASFLVLLVACTNLASAMLARGTARAREYSLRRSIGAGDGQLVRHVLTESAILSLAGAALGVGFAALAIRALPTLAPAGIPRIDEVRLDGVVLAVALALALVTGLLFGLLPALRVNAGDVGEALRTGGRGGVARGRHRAWNALIAIEVALALTLLTGSGLLLRSFRTVLRVQPGFRTSDVLTATVNPPASTYPDGKSRIVYLDDLLRALETVPDLGSVGLVSAAPMTGVANGGLAIRGGERDNITAEYQLADSGYFATLGIPLIRGRLFDSRDDAGTMHVVVVSETFAKTAWPGQDALGMEMTGGGMDDFWDQDRWATVIGVVGDIRQTDLTEPSAPVAYFPYSQRPFRTWSMTIVARPERGEAAGLGPPIRDVIGGIDSDVPVTFRTIESRIADSLVPRRFTMLILVLFAASALALACVGIWGVVAYAVARRTREIGIRMALGADAKSVRRLVQRGYLRAAAIGAGAGLLLALALTRLLQSLLYEVEPTDPVTIGAVLAVLAAAAWVASWVPARRTVRISPMETMRAE